MKKAKIFFAILMSVCMLAIAFIGCPQPDTDDGGKTTTTTVKKNTNNNSSSSSSSGSNSASSPSGNSSSSSASNDSSSSASDSSSSASESSDAISGTIAIQYSSSSDIRLSAQNTTLTASMTGVTTFAWYVNDVLQQSNTTATFNAENCQSGDIIVVTATKDGHTLSATAVVR